MPPFGHQRETLCHAIRDRGAGNVLAVEFDGAAIGDDAGDCLQERGLAGAVGADQNRQRARLDREVDAMDDRQTVVAGAQLR